MPKAAPHSEPGLLVEELRTSARPCEQHCRFISEVLGICPGDFIYWDGGPGAFKEVVSHERLFELKIQTQHGDRSLCVDMADHKPCQECFKEREIDFGVVVRRGRVVEDGTFVRAKGKKGRLVRV